MSQWGQPANFALVGDRPCRLQVLDPELAFELEPQIIERVGEALLLSVTAPGAVAKSVREVISGEARITTATAALEQLAQLARGLLSAPGLDGPWVVEVIERTIFDRLVVDGTPVGSWREWGRLGLSPFAKWQALAAQLTQTFGPLWTRSPYSAGQRPHKDYGVPQPSASRTVQWAAALASSGYVGSVDEVLRSWTPDRMIDLVEIAAADCERQRRASDAATAGGG